MKVAIVHYWLVKMRGGENVLQALCEIYPDADIFTHVYCRENISEEINTHKITTSFIQKLPWAEKLYQSYLPLMPFALKQLDLTGYDLIISSESGPAKGVRVPKGAKHICYCHTPMRYVWDMYVEYKNNAGYIKQMLMPGLVWWLRRWDKETALGVDQFIANSRFVQQRIRNIYGRDSKVIYPPVSVDQFTISARIESYYLYVGELTHYKQPRLAVEAFNVSGRRLLVIGEGDMENELKLIARPNIEFMGRQSFDDLKIYFSQCKALIFPGIEDFGIIPVEVMASGRPVIAYAGGGALETVTEHKSGLFFSSQTVDSLNNAVENFENNESEFVASNIRHTAESFSKQRFKSEMLEIVGSVF